jgi:hypothetical protein
MNIDNENGMALLVVLLALLLASALGASLVLTTSSETIIAGNFRTSIDTSYAAGAAAERAIAELNGVADWNAVLSGIVTSSFVDGLPSGPRRMADGSTIVLSEIVSLANCGKPRPCTSAEMDAVTSSRPWGVNNPRWQLYAYGWLRDTAPDATVRSSCYVIVLVADDPAENDGNPLQDGAGTGNPGTGVIAVRAEARGPRGARKVVELTIARQAGPQLRSWRQLP